MYGIEKLPSLGEKVLPGPPCQSAMLKKSGHWVTFWVKSYKNCKLCFGEDTQSSRASTTLRIREKMLLPKNSFPEIVGINPHLWKQTMCEILICWPHLPHVM